MSLTSASASALADWNASLRSICGHFDTQVALNSSLFIGDIALRNHSGLNMAHLRTNAGLISRPLARSDHGEDANCFLISQRSGHSQISLNGVSVRLAPGDLVLMDSVGAGAIQPLGLIEHASLSLPRSEVQRVLRQPLFGRISAKRSSGRMLHLLIDQICRDSQSSDDGEEAQALEAALIALLAPALTQDDELDPSHEPLHGASLRQHVQQVIDDNLREPTLTPLGLANRLNISVRHLYRLFEEQGDSVCRYIQRSRLQRSADDLANPVLKTESITSIAYKWGFTDSAHFSRAFKRQFEQSPKDFRHQALVVGR